MRDSRRKSLEHSHVQFDEHDQTRVFSDDESSEDEIYVEPFDPNRLKVDDDEMLERRDGKVFLDLSRLELTHLPLEVGSIGTIQGLILADNQITRLPKALGRLKILEILDARNNIISTVSADLGKFKYSMILRWSEINVWLNIAFFFRKSQVFDPLGHQQQPD